jgi:hypothetical protein
MVATTITPMQMATMLPVESFFRGFDGASLSLLLLLLPPASTGKRSGVLGATVLPTFEVGLSSEATGSVTLRVNALKVVLAGVDEPVDRAVGGAAGDTRDDATGEKKGRQRPQCNGQSLRIFSPTTEPTSQNSVRALHPPSSTVFSHGSDVVVIGLVDGTFGATVVVDIECVIEVPVAVVFVLVVKVAVVPVILVEDAVVVDAVTVVDVFVPVVCVWVVVVVALEEAVVVDDTVAVVEVSVTVVCVWVIV